MRLDEITKEYNTLTVENSSTLKCVKTHTINYWNILFYSIVNVFRLVGAPISAPMPCSVKFLILHSNSKMGGVINV